MCSIEIKSIFQIEDIDWLENDWVLQFFKVIDLRNWDTMVGNYYDKTSLMSTVSHIITLLTVKLFLC